MSRFSCLRILLPTLLLAWLAPVTSSAQGMYGYAVNLLNLDPNGPLMGTLSLDGATRSTPFVPYGSWGQSDAIWSDNNGVADGVLVDTNGAHHSFFTSNPNGSYLIALPGDNISLYDEGRGILNATDRVQNVTHSELNGATVDMKINSHRHTLYPNGLQFSDYFGITMDQKEWWILRRTSNYMEIDVYLHHVGDSIMVGSGSQAFGKYAARANLQNDSARVRFVNTSSNSSLILEIDDLADHAVDPLAVSPVQAVPGIEHSVRIRNGSDAIIDTVLAFRPYGFYDLVLLTDGDNRLMLKVDERIRDAFVPNVVPAYSTRADSTHPYWDGEFRLVFEPVKEGENNRYRLVDRYLRQEYDHEIHDVFSVHRGFDNTQEGDGPYFELLDDRQSRIARFDMGSDLTGNRVFVLRQGDGTPALYSYDEFLREGQQLKIHTTVPKESLPIGAQMWKFAERIDSVVLSIPSLSILDTVRQRVVENPVAFNVEPDAAFEILDMSAQVQEEGVLSAPAGGAALLLVDDEPEGGLRSYVHAVGDGKRVNHVTCVNFTEGLGALFVYEDNVVNQRVLDSIPEGKGLSFSAADGDTLYFQIRTAAGDTLFRSRVSSVYNEDLWVFDGGRHLGEVRRYGAGWMAQSRGLGVGYQTILKETGGVRENALLLPLSISPNPVGDAFDVRFPAFTSDNAVRTIAVVNVEGETVESIYVGKLNRSNSSIRIACAEYPAGTYFLQAIDGSGGIVGVAKFVVASK